MKTIKLSNLVSPQSLLVRSTMYNETLHDKTGSFLASVSANITQLSDGSIQDITQLFQTYHDLLWFILGNVDVTWNEALALCDAVFPLYDA